MTIRSGQYEPVVKLRKLNISSVPVRVKSTNNKMNKTSKAFPIKVRASNAPTNKSSKAVSKKTKGLKGAGKSFKKGTAGVNTSRVDQVSPAQRSPRMSPAPMVAINARGQNKKPVSNGKTSLSMFRKSIKRTMGY